MKTSLALHALPPHAPPPPALPLTSRYDFGGVADDALIALTTPPLDYYCRVIKGAMQGWGIDEGPITRVLGSLDKSEIGDLKARDQKPHTPRAPRPPARAR